MRMTDLDVTWTADRAHEVVGLQFPQFADQTPTLLGRGWDNLCVLYPDSTVFRLPTRQLGGDIMTIECAVLPKIAPFMNIGVPDFQYFGQPKGDYQWQFVGYPFLVGLTSENLSWTADERTKAATALGRFLNGLHKIPISPELQQVLPPDLIDRTRPVALLKRIEKFSGQIQEAFPDRIRWAKNLHDLGHEIGQGVNVEPMFSVVHGDLYPRHILADDLKQITGIIDWGDVHLGHPFLDISIAYTFLEASERDEFWSAYQLPVSLDMKAMARLKAINYALILFLYGHHTQDEKLIVLSDLIANRVQRE